MKPVVKALIDNYRWLKKRNLYHPDVVIDELTSPWLVINEKTFISFCYKNIE